jgi:hypothetical protein
MEIKMREITSHVVNPVNDKLKIFALDEPGSGGANHIYRVRGADRLQSNPAVTQLHEDVEPNDIYVTFQNGGIVEAGVNGITQEVLLAIVEDRLTCFQKGPFACLENAYALSHVRIAMQILQNRTRERMSRGVEGRSVK